MKQKNKNNKRKIATTSMAILGVTLVVSGVFAALSDTLSHDESVVIEWVDIVDGSSANLALEDVSDATNTPVEELTPGITYELTGSLDNDSTVATDWSAINQTTTPGMSVNIADPDGADVALNPGEAIDVAQFGITVTVDQSIEPSTPLNFAIEFTSTDARVMLTQATAINVVFPDPALATCVANDDELVAITGGDVNYQISQTELNSINDLSCIDQGVINIEGVQYLNNIKTLNLSFNEITDLTPLSNLTSLTYLDLDGNNIVDITPVMYLENLTYLDLAHNEIIDIDVLSNLNDLEFLDLSGNQISDLTALSDLTNLTKLYLEENQIEDITALSNLINLETLDLDTNQLVDITPLNNLVNLTYLSLQYNDIANIEPLANLTNLKYLYIRGNEISDITPLSNLNNLISLSIATNQVSDLSPVAGLTNLENLYLDNNYITDFSMLTYQPTTFDAAPQNPITLPDTNLGTPTSINIDGINGADFTITWQTPGTYVNGQLTWENPGVNSLTYQNSDGTITGTITQTVN